MCRDVVVMSRSTSEDAVRVAAVKRKCVSREGKKKRTSACRRQRSLLDEKRQ